MKNTLKINDWKIPVLFCKYLCNESSDLHEILCAGQLQVWDTFEFNLIVESQIGYSNIWWILMSLLNFWFICEFGHKSCKQTADNQKLHGNKAFHNYIRFPTCWARETNEKIIDDYSKVLIWLKRSVLLSYLLVEILICLNDILIVILCARNLVPSYFLEEYPVIFRNTQCEEIIVHII